MDLQQAQASSSNATLFAQSTSTTVAELDHRTSLPTQLRSVKLDFLRFDGTDAPEWIFQAEQFFDYYDISDTYRLKLTAMHMARPAVPLFQML